MSGRFPDGSGSREPSPVVSALRASIPSAYRCECRLCLYAREVSARLEVIPEDHRAFFAEMYDQLNNVEFDNDWYRSIADGSWPDAVPILTHWLAAAQAMSAGTAETPSAAQGDSPPVRSEGCAQKGQS